MRDFCLRPFFIRVLVPTGEPDGLRIVEKSNWTGVGVVFIRTNYAATRSTLSGPCKRIQ